jgi:hypothetical protein
LGQHADAPSVSRARYGQNSPLGHGLGGGVYRNP